MKTMTESPEFAMRPMKILRFSPVLAVVLTITLVAAACNGRNSYNPTAPMPTVPPPPGTPRPTATPGPSVTMVTGGNLFFSPQAVTVHVGGTVQWNWNSGGVSHSTTSGPCPSCNPDGRWDSGVRSMGSFSHTFTSSDLGTRPYYCRVHLAMMTGIVQVNP
ncbi:MAG: hypothetical protein L3J97_07750 [Thermoplasmata archaeon]|nr:hypothetical protein [Thermoplasmata archaeon]